MRAPIRSPVASLIVVAIGMQSVSVRAAVVALAGAVACGGSSRRAPESREVAGSGGIASGGHDNQGAMGGTGPGAAGGRAGAGGRGGGPGAGAGGTAAAAGRGTAAAGIGGSAGAPPASGGAAGASAGQAGAGQAGAGGSVSAAFAPPWLPTGAFGVAAQHVVDAATEYTFWLCVANGLADRCIFSELHNFAPSLEWLACASRAPGADLVLEEFASQFFACAEEQRECGCDLILCDATVPDMPGCPSYQSEACPSGGTFEYRCDAGGLFDCSDGYDQRNCDPSATRYDCGDGDDIAWTAVCDGSPDCATEVDEFRCGPTSGDGGAAGAAAGE
jgi:hypothetical protein